MHSIANAIRNCFNRPRTHSGANSRNPPVASKPPVSTPSATTTDAARATRNWVSRQAEPRPEPGWGARPLAPGSRGTRPGGHRTTDEMQLSEVRSRASKIRATEQAQAISLAVSRRAVQDTLRRIERSESAPSGISTEQVRKNLFKAHTKVVANAFNVPTVIVDSNGSRVHRDPGTSEAPKPPVTKPQKPALLAVVNAGEQSTNERTGGEAPVGSVRRLIVGVPLTTIVEEREASSMLPA